MKSFVSITSPKWALIWNGIISLVLVFLHLHPADALADVKITHLSTPHGNLVSRAGSGKECGQYLIHCQVITLKGKVLFADFSATILAVYPSPSNPSLVTLEISNGGNCCPGYNYVIDFTTPSPIIIKDANFSEKLFQTENGISYTQFIGPDELGDPIYGLYRYVLGSGRPELLRKFAEYSMTPLQQKKYGSEILNDPTLRAPVLAAVGKSHFSSFRANMEIATDELHVDDRYVFSSGCMPHNCDGAGGLFVLDLDKKAAWAIEWEGENKVTLWGDLRKDDVTPIRAIGDWLKKNNLSWTMVRVAPPSLSVEEPYAPAKKEESASKPDLHLDASGKTTVDLSSTNTNREELSPVALFKLVAPSIFVVNAKRGNGDEFQGSAVAISANTLLTNCHVIDGASEINLTQKGVSYPVTLTSANIRADRCILQTTSQLRNYVPIRPYNELEIGEKVYSVGAPLGLELTLADGILSGKRTFSDSRLVQTTAPISPGSSGGGLFDASGNLVGITTFLLKESENLNFAIAAQEYLQ